MELSGEFLVGGVSWSRHAAVWSLFPGSGRHAEILEHPLEPGSALRFRVLTPTGSRHCLGYSTVEGPTSRAQLLCRDGDDAVRGFQCERCFVRDDFRFLHDIHRSGIAPPGLQAYIDQAHWLYIATFADGVSKVGTAAHRSKFTRLAEQGAVVARYVAWAKDGRIIRRLEDAVSEAIGLPQAVRAAAKLTALLNPLPPAELDRTNADTAAAVRTMLDGGGLADCRVVDEQWKRPEPARHLCEAGPGLLYPHELATGEHGLLVHAVHGSFAKVRIDDCELEFLLDLSRLKGKRMTFGNYRSAVPAVQESLF